MAIAAAIMLKMVRPKNASLILVDEATSSLDSMTEHKVQQALLQLAKGTTMITIAHRLSTIRHCDRIIVLREGKVAQEGTFTDLISREGTFRDMWKQQQSHTN
ncbi:MAG: hypothetical protein ACE5DX_06050 [Candidatus Dojkabacteria bacterium]